MATMKAAVFHEHGGADKLQMADLPVPEPGPAQVRVKVAWGALNHLDLWTRNGLPGVTLAMPHIGISDIAGTVDKAGEGVQGWSPGDRVVVNPGLSCGECTYCRRGEDATCRTYGVMGEHAPGGAAEYAVVPTRNLLRVPDGFSLKKACAANLSYMTAYRMVKSRAQVNPGENVLVLGAGSGVSTAAIQIAKRLGATVYATTSTKEKEERAKALGADMVVNYKDDPDWHKTFYKATDKHGMDVVVDHIGEQTWAKSVRALAKGGRLVTCGGTTGPQTTQDVRLLFWRQLSILGSTMAHDREYREVMSLVFDGHLEPPIDEAFPLEGLADAHRRMERHEQFGKIMIRVSGEE
jgi:NADPH:quinone reductase-like Zn-dependent oxidoreductase